jgi:hypothetical protein
MLCPLCHLPLFTRPVVGCRIHVWCSRCKAIFGIDLVVLKDKEISDEMCGEYTRGVAETYGYSDRSKLPEKKNGSNSDGSK